jgi:hypothetical protein
LKSAREVQSSCSTTHPFFTLSQSLRCTTASLGSLGTDGAACVACVSPLTLTAVDSNTSAAIDAARIVKMV